MNFIKVKELEEAILTAEQKASKKVDQLFAENKELNGKLLKLEHNLKEATKE